MSILTSPYPTSDQGSVSLEPVFASEIVNVSEKLAQSRKRQASASLRLERSLGPDGAPGDPQGPKEPQEPQGPQDDSHI